MATRGSLTILLITAERLVRADIRAGRSSPACQVYQQPRPAVDDLPSLVEATVHLGPKKIHRVLLLCSDFWTQTLPLSAGTAGSMSKAELSQALAFEAEPFSGISAFDSLGSCVSLPVEGDQRHFWFTQVMASLWEQVEYVVEQAGGKLVGAAHPAGLLQSLRADAPQRARWQRVELWPEAVVCLHGEASTPLRVHIINSAPQPGLWEADADAWFGRFDPPDVRETLLGTERVPPGDVAGADGDILLDLGDEAALEGWLGAWAEQLAARLPGVPLIRPAPKPMQNSTRFAIAGLLGIAVLLPCLGHYWWAGSTTRRAEEQLTSVKRPAEELEKVKKQAGELEKQLGALKQQTATMSADLEKCRGALDAQRERMVRLLAALAESAPDEFVIQAIDGQRAGIRVRGICLRPDQANQLALAMDEKLRPLGLRVHLPEKQAQYLLADGGPYVFDLLIQDVAGLKGTSHGHGVAGSPSRNKGVSTPVKKPSTSS